MGDRRGSIVHALSLIRATKRLSSSSHSRIQKEIEDTVERNRENIHIIPALRGLRLRRNNRIAARQLKLYLLFLLVLLCATFLGRSIQSQYLFNYTVRNSLVEQKPRFEVPIFNEVGEYDEFWRFLENGFSTGLCDNVWYNGNNKTKEEIGLIANRLRPVGFVVFRTIRLKGDSCEIENALSTIVDGKCYGRFAKKREMKEKIIGESGMIYEWNNDNPADFGSIAGWYGTGGYRVKIPVNTEEMIEKYNDGCVEWYNTLAKMKQDLFIDRSTAMLSITTTLVDSGSNLVGNFRLLFEIAPSGGIFSNFYLQPFTLSLYSSTTDYARGFFEFVLVIFIISYTVSLMLEWRRSTRAFGSVFKFLETGWNVLEIATLISFFMWIFTRLTYIAISRQVTSGPVNIEGADADRFQVLGMVAVVDSSLSGLNIMLSVLTLFRYMRLSARLSLLWIVLAHASRDLLSFTVMFFLVFIAYSTMGHLIFGHAVPGWSTFMNSNVTLFRMLVGDISYSPMAEANRVLAPVFFLSFTILLFFILVNVFLAICTDSYAEIQKQLHALERRSNEEGVALKLLRNTRTLVRGTMIALLDLITCGIFRRRRQHKSDSRVTSMSTLGESRTGKDHEHSGTTGVPGIIAGRGDIDDIIDGGLWEHLLWACSGETMVEKEYALICAALEQLAYDRCSEAGCILPPNIQPEFRDSPDMREVHTCSLDHVVTLEVLKQALTEMNPKTPLPADDRLDRVAVLANTFVELKPTITVSAADIDQAKKTPRKHLQTPRFGSYGIAASSLANQQHNNSSNSLSIPVGGGAASLNNHPSFSGGFSVHGGGGGGGGNALFPGARPASAAASTGAGAGAASSAARAGSGKGEEGLFDVVMDLRKQNEALNRKLDMALRMIERLAGGEAGAHDHAGQRPHSGSVDTAHHPGGSGNNNASLRRPPLLTFNAATPQSHSPVPHNFPHGGFLHPHSATPSPYIVGGSETDSIASPLVKKPSPRSKKPQSDDSDS